MIGALQGHVWHWIRAAPSADATRTRPASAGQPVFIHDAVTPWRGETLLLAHLRQDAAHIDDQS